jgi:hypothetical protein
MLHFSHFAGILLKQKRPSQPQGVGEKDALGRFLPQDQDGDGYGLNKRKASSTSPTI